MRYFNDIIALFKFYRTRIIFSLTGIAIAVGAICALIALNGIVTSNSKEFIEKFGGARFVLNVMTTSQSQKTSNENLRYTQIHHFVKLFNEEFSMIPYRILSLKARFELKDLDAMSIATTHDIFDMMQWPIEQGRKLHLLDQNDKVVVIGSKVADKLRRQGLSNIIGQAINLDGHFFNIVGILQEKEFNPILDFDVNYAVLLDLHLLGRFENNSILDSFIVQGKKYDLKTAENKLKAQLAKQLHKVRFFFRDALLFEQALFKQVALTMNILSIVAGVTLFLGIISILNLLFILVDERKKEIGLRLSVGATANDIAKQFLFETLCLCLVGGCAGILLGEMLAYFIVQQLEITYYTPWFSWIVGLPISLLIGLVVGLIPARIAGRLDPVTLING